MANAGYVFRNKTYNPNKTNSANNIKIMGHRLWTINNGSLCRIKTMQSGLVEKHYENRKK